MSLGPNRPSRLKRLATHYYQHKAWVHWVMTIDQRASGWLDADSHHNLRELLLHTCARYQLHCPAYCLMPDHAHFLWMGLNERSHQLNAQKFLHRGWNPSLELSGCQLQRQSYDHVLLETERNPDALEDTILYIFHNPEEEELVEEWPSWPFLGAIIPGYPQIPVDPISQFWPKFWKIHNACTNKEASPNP